jgi:hypothetical protein
MTSDQNRGAPAEAGARKRPTPGTRTGSAATPSITPLPERCRWERTTPMATDAAPLRYQKHWDNEEYRAGLRPEVEAAIHDLNPDA